MGEYMHVIMRSICRRHPEIRIFEVNTDKDHIHLLVELAPKMSIAEAVKILKAHTGLMMRKKFTFLDQVYWGADGIWSTGYGRRERINYR
jgi:putative transposase